MTPDKPIAEIYLAAADQYFREEKYFDALETARKVLDAFPPLNREKMKEAHLLLAHSRRELAGPVPWWRGFTNKRNIQAARIKANIRMDMHAAQQGLISIRSCIASVTQSIQMLEAQFEPREKHPELLVNLAETMMAADDNKSAKSLLDEALSFGADAKKVFFMMMNLHERECQFAKTGNEYSEALALARECMHLFLKAARDDKSAGAYAWPAIEDVLDLETEKAPAHDFQPTPSQG